MRDLASRAGYRAAEEEAEWRDHVHRYRDPRTVRRHYGRRPLPHREPGRCKVDGCERIGMIYLNAWTYVCSDCDRALRARRTEVQDE